MRFWQLFFSYFKELVGKEVTVELKNDLAITGILHSVDQYLNIKLENTRVVDEAKYPHMVFPSLSPNLLALCFYHVFCFCVCSMYFVVVLSFVMADIVKQFEVSFYQFSSPAFAFLTGQWHYYV